jgi:hypothetical protein
VALPFVTWKKALYLYTIATPFFVWKKVSWVTPHQHDSNKQNWGRGRGCKVHSLKLIIEPTWHDGWLKKSPPLHVPAVRAPSPCYESLAGGALSLDELVIRRLYVAGVWVPGVQFLGATAMSHVMST